MGSGTGEILQQVRENGQEYFSERKRAVATELENVGSAFRRAADRLHDAKSDALAEYIEVAAERVEGIGEYIAEHDLRDVADDVTELARRRPLLFTGGMFLAGLAAARFARAASAQKR